ncbi:hypothetical protein ATJ97_1553 [Georgenia soli]|uniref:Uncharacterized protein n=1 Tax=Georgenia soli TaxID=638953 RepID=A0A2A9EJH5_9MICO|nr:hypothetical protein [Georgenia soli]PFG39058.1 hypothetical protein ATJ97_1553 [Georgenia soli]
MLEISRPDARLVAALRHLGIEYGPETVAAAAQALAVLAEAERELEPVRP